MIRIGWQFACALALGVLAVVALGLEVATVPALYLAATAPELVRIDLAEQRLPNRLVLPGVLIGLVAAAGSWFTTGSPPVVPVVAGLAFAALLLCFTLAGGMGMGDVKLAAVIGLASPTLGIALGAPVLAFLLGGVVALVLLVARGRRARIAFGPFLLGGYAVALALSAAVVLAGRE